MDFTRRKKRGGAGAEEELRKERTRVKKMLLNEETLFVARLRDKQCRPQDAEIFRGRRRDSGGRREKRIRKREGSGSKKGPGDPRD